MFRNCLRTFMFLLVFRRSESGRRILDFRRDEVQLLERDYSTKSYIDVDGTRRNYKLDKWSRYVNPELSTSEEGDIGLSRDSRRIYTNTAETRWPNGLVPFTIDKGLRNSLENVDAILSAMKQIMDATDNCVQFYPVGTEEHSPNVKRALKIKSVRSGCVADVGYSKSSGGQLNLDLDACITDPPGHIVHELMHVLGQLHEQMRPDRDQYVDILWHNIKKGMSSNFKMVAENTVESYGLPYDYKSIMHYPMTAFSKNEDDATIVPKVDGTSIGQRVRLSYYDVLKLRRAYKCNSSKQSKIFERTTSTKTDPAMWTIVIPESDTVDSDEEWNYWMKFRTLLIRRKNKQIRRYAERTLLKRRKNKHIGTQIRRKNTSDTQKEQTDTHTQKEHF